MPKTKAQSKCGCDKKHDVECRGPGKHFDVSWIEDNPYSLLIDVDPEAEVADMTLKELRRVNTASEVTKKITAILEQAAGDIASLERHRVGIGDTDTDERIIDEFYSLIH